MDHDLIFAGPDNIHVIKGIEDKIGMLFASLWGQQLVILTLGICCYEFTQLCKAKGQAMFLKGILEWWLLLFIVPDLVLAP